MRSLSIKKLVSILALAMIVMVGAMAFVSVDTSVSYKELTAEKRVLVAAQLQFKDVRYNIVQIQQFITDVSATGDLEPMAEAKANLLLAKQHLKELAEVLENNAEMIKKIGSQIDGLYNTGEKMATAYRTEGRDAGNILMQRPETGFDAVSGNLANEVDMLGKHLGDKVDAMDARLDAYAETSLQITIGIGVVGMILAVFAGFSVFNKIVGPIESLRTSLIELNKGNGDLSKRLPQKGDCEIGMIIAQFNTFIAKLQNIISKIDASIEPVISVAQAVSDVSQETNKGARAQALETDRVATAVTEMTAAVNEVAQNAAIAMNSTREAEEKAGDGQKVVAETVSSINELAAEVDTASKVIKQLEEFSGDIGGVLDVIKGIAEQTNLLALNAAIEAARAGEQGRGFAVVADEVRTLAGRTQNSTAEIERMTEQLQGAAKDAVLVMSRGHDKASISVDNASKAGDALAAIMSSVTTIAEMNAQIATSAEEQSHVAEEINQNVVSISQVTEKTVSQAESTTNESKKLVLLARDLESLVNQFRS